MSARETVTELTQRGIYFLLDENKRNIIVQILEPEPITNQKDPKSVKFKVLISDGFAKQKAVLGNEAASVFDSHGQPAYCIIRINDLMQNQQGNKRLVIVTKIEIVNTEVTEVIGGPIEYQEWLNNNKTNKAGNNKIPPKFLPTLRSSVSSGSYNTLNNASAPMNAGNAGGYNNPPNSRTFTSSANQEFNANANRNPNPTSYNSNTNIGSNGGPNSRLGGGQFQQQNMNNNQRTSFNGGGGVMPNNNATFNSRNANQNQNYENVPPAASNQQKTTKKQGSIGYINTNQNQININDDQFMSVNQLAAYTQFLIKVRVTSKGDIRRFQKQGTGQGVVFSADLIDREGNEITATFFGEAAEFFEPLLQENCVYIMKNGNVKLTNSKFNKRNDTYQIIYDRQDPNAITKVENDADIVMNKFNFTKIQALQETPVNTIVDVAGFVKDVYELSDVRIQKTAEVKEKRDFSIYDNTNTLVKMTIWGDMARNIVLPKGKLILIKGARVSDFGGAKSLSGFGTKIITDESQFPQDDPIIEELVDWKRKDFVNDEQLSSISHGGGGKFTPWTIEEINNVVNSSTFADVAFFDVTAFIGHVKTDQTALFYPACQTCNKKAVLAEDSRYKCINPDCKDNHSQPTYRYALSIKLSDPTGSLWMSAFDKHGKTIIGEDADQIKALKDTDEMAMNEKIKEALHKEYRIRLVAKRDNYMSNERIKFQATRVEPIDYSRNGKDLLNLLDEYAKI